MRNAVRPQLGRVVAMPLAAVGVMASVLVWEVEHVGSLTVAIIVAASVLSAAFIIAHRVRHRIEELSTHYQGLLDIADAESRRAEAANRLKDEFLATLSHELRTPLHAILGWSRLLSSGKLSPEQTKRAVQAIERAGWTQNRLVGDLLDLQQVVAGTVTLAMSAVFVRPVVESAIQSLATAAAAKHLDVRTQFDSKAGVIAADPDRLRQVVWHLMSNAIKFTPDGGHVLVSVRRGDHDVVIEVHDTGIGFESDVAEHLFERFRQGDSSSTRQFGGLGVGLGIVRHLVELHGGVASARSRGENKGSTFSVRFPIGDVEKLAIHVTHTREPAWLDGVSVLVVDHDAEALASTRGALEQYGAFVSTASSIDEAREQFTRDPPDVLLSELRIGPRADGYQLIEMLRRLEPKGRATPSAALTSFARTEDRAHALAAGYRMHIAKPISPPDLAAAVERLAHGDLDRRASGMHGR